MKPVSSSSPGAAFKTFAKDFVKIMSSRLEGLRDKVMGNITKGIQDKGNVVLIPGLLGKKSDFIKLKKRLINEGYKVHTVSMKYENKSLEECVNEVRDKTLNMETFTLVGYSLGGVVAAEATRTMAGKIDKVITINSPLQGTDTAKEKWAKRTLKILSLKEDVRGVIEKGIKNRAKLPKDKFYHIGSKEDYLVNDIAKNSLKGSKDTFILEEGGHYPLREDVLIDKVVEWISEGKSKAG